MPSATDREGEKPSDFDKCLKLDVIGGAKAVMEPCLSGLRVSSPDAVCMPFYDTRNAAFSFQSVYFDRDTGSWAPSRKYVCAPLTHIHHSLFRADVPLQWKCLYEIIPHDRARHFYFDLEEDRPVGTSTVEHDAQYWLKVQQIQAIFRDTFR